MKNILITWFPKSWKSTLLNKIIKNFNNKTGFITKEILDKKLNKRIWFQMVSSTWKKELLAYKGLESDYRVWKYWVKINNINIILSEINKYNKTDLLYIDEIWEMEMFSEEFKNLVLNYINTDNLFIWTISKIYNDNFLKNIKKRDDAIVFELNENNRSEIEIKIKEYLINNMQWNF